MLEFEVKVTIDYSSIENIIEKVPAENRENFFKFIENLIHIVATDPKDNMQEFIEDCNYVMHYQILPQGEFSEHDIDRLVDFAEMKGSAVKSVTNIRVRV